MQQITAHHLRLSSTLLLLGLTLLNALIAVPTAEAADLSIRETQIRIAGWAADEPSQTYLAIDGVWGPKSREALKRFQKAYGLRQSGEPDDAATQQVLKSLEKQDGSTTHFNWSEFYSHGDTGFSGGKVPASEVKENVRRLMYKLEALRKKIKAPVQIISGFRTVAHNTAIGGARNSMHMYGVAADIRVPDHTIRQIYRVAETCGFSGLERYTISHQHLDSRVEYPRYGSPHWWWENGKIY